MFLKPGMQVPVSSVDTRHVILQSGNDACGDKLISPPVAGMLRQADEQAM